jgi:ADP-ribose pyrophosphatase YjhB (NUDIX family)
MLTEKVRLMAAGGSRAALRPAQGVPSPGGATPRAGAFPVVVHVIVVSDRRLLTVRERLGGSWVLPCGLVPHGVGVFDAAVRVVASCVGAGAERAGAHVAHVQFDRSGVEVIRVFVQLPRLAGAPAVGDRHRFDGVGWHPPDRLPGPVPAALRAAVDGWGRGAVFSEVPSATGAAGAGRS